MSRELRYWRETGLALGTARYRRYLHLFGLSANACTGLIVCDYGCGPFGGVLSVLTGIRCAYPVDVLAATYNGWQHCAARIRGIDSHGQADVPNASCEVAFCLNALDHVPDPSPMVADLARILKPRGALYLFVHIRTGAKGHYHMTVQQTMSLLDAWDIQSVTTGRDIPNLEPTLDALWLTAVRL